MAIGVLAIAGPVGAQQREDEPRGPRLEYAAPPGCPSEETFRHEVALLTQGVDHFRATAADVVRVTFAKVPGGYRGTVEYTPATGAAWPAKHETGPVCPLLAQLVGLVASLRIPDLPPKGAPVPVPLGAAHEARDPIRSKGAAAWVPPLMVRERLQASNPPPSPPQEDMDVAIGLSGFVLMSAGYTANVSPGFQLGAEVRSFHEQSDVFRLGLELRGILPGKVYAREPIDPKLATYPAEFDISQFSALLVPCVRWRYLLGCGVAELGAVMFQDDVRFDTALLIRFGPRLGLEIPFREHLRGARLR